MDANKVLFQDALLLHIFDLLPNEDLVTAGQVCRDWRRVARDKSLWAHRELQRSGHEHDAQVLRILRFAPQLNKFDSKFKTYFSNILCPGRIEQYRYTYRTGRKIHVSPKIKIRSLNVTNPTVSFIEQFEESLEKLSVHTSSRKVLEIVTKKCDSLTRLDLCWTGHDVDIARVLWPLLGKHRLALHFISVADFIVQNRSCFKKQLMEFLVQCPNLRIVGMPLNWHLPLLSALPLEHLLLDLEVKDPDITTISLPTNVRLLTLRTIMCPLTENVAQALIEACLKINTLEVVNLWPLQSRDVDAKCCNLNSLRAALKPGLIIQCFCNGVLDRTATTGHFQE